MSEEGRERAWTDRPPSLWRLQSVFFILTRLGKVGLSSGSLFSHLSQGESALVTVSGAGWAPSCGSDVGSPMTKAAHGTAGGGKPGRTASAGSGAGLGSQKPAGLVPYGSCGAPARAETLPSGSPVCCRDSGAERRQCFSPGVPGATEGHVTCWDTRELVGQRRREQRQAGQDSPRRTSLSHL